MIKRVFLLLDLILFFQMVLHEKMNSAQTIMWTLILLLLPGVGTVLYLLIGSSFPTVSYSFTDTFVEVRKP